MLSKLYQYRPRFPVTKNSSALATEEFYIERITVTLGGSRAAAT
jgi:hypothetical protein